MIVGGPYEIRKAFGEELHRAPGGGAGEGEAGESSLPVRVTTGPFGTFAVGQPVTAARAVLGLSELALTSGNPAEALVYGQRASHIFRGLGASLDHARALTLRSEAHTALGDTDAARVASSEAAALKGSRADGGKITHRA